MQRLVFQLGTNNWQRNGEFAPGSGILHETHHRALNARDETSAYSLYPSKTQRFSEEFVRVFELDHDIPICESISPVSSYRWHSMSEMDFLAYVDRLTSVAMAWIDEIEAEHDASIDLAVAHHTFVNPLVLQQINQQRSESGRPRIPILCFVHGTAMKMYAAELAQELPGEFPWRFLPLVRSSGVFGDSADRAVDWCAAISTEQVDKFTDLFPDYPADRVVLSPNGFNQDLFTPQGPSAATDRDAWQNWRDGVLAEFPTMPYTGSAEPVRSIDPGYDAVVLFCGKFAAWKRLDALLHAAALYETWPERVATVVVGSGPHDDQVHYQDLARQLGLEHVHFVGPQPQDQLTRLFSAADVACFPSRNEPFGLVFIEAMACGTPVIGANSGGPRDFVTDAVGTLVDESDDPAVLGRNIAAACRKAVTSDWKTAKGPIAAQTARAEFSVRTQVDRLLDAIDALGSHENLIADQTAAASAQH